MRQNFDEIKNIICAGINDAKVEVTDLTGSGDHLGLLIVSNAFEGKILIQKHRMVMDLLAEKLKGELHAVQLKTLTCAQAQEQGINI